jgi:xanthine dehydrogenase YagS FAD-binding subunit
VHPFAYARPDDLGTAVAAVTGDPAATFIAGGTELVNWMKDGIARPALVVDLGGLPLSAIDETPEGGLRIGALARMSMVAEDAAVRARYPVLAEALEAGASPQIRNAATVGGNLSSGPAAPTSGKPPSRATSGSRVPAAPPAPGRTTCTPSSAAATPASPSTRRTWRWRCSPSTRPSSFAAGRRPPRPARRVLPAAGETPERETVLRHGEVIVAVELPATGLAVRSRYLKVRERASFAFALVSGCGGGRTWERRPGARGADRPRLRGAEAVAGARGRGRPCRGMLDAEAAAAAGRAAVAGAEPLPDTAYKVTLVERAVARTLAEIGGWA